MKQSAKHNHLCVFAAQGYYHLVILLQQNTLLPQKVHLYCPLITNFHNETKTKGLFLLVKY